MKIFANVLSGAKRSIPELKTPQFTRSGSPVKPLTRGLPKTVESLCPECNRIIEARLFEEDGKVMMEKNCPKHGYFKDLYWSNAELYLRVENFVFEDGQGLVNPNVVESTRCDVGHCGLCNMHLSSTICGNVDLTNRCDMTCPICFANANVTGYVYEPSLEQVLGMLHSLRAERPVSTPMVQFSGGEPTIYPHFLDVVRAARDMGFAHIQVATNGLTLADPEFAEACKEAGLHTVYLQFDGLDDNIYRRARGRAMVEVKLKVVENVRRAGMKVVLVPTIVNGLNDNQVGEILKFAVENSDVISGISYQPVCFSGRISRRERGRFTLADMARCIEEQTGLISMEDWYPVAFTVPFSKFIGTLWGKEVGTLTCHPHCGIATYLFVDLETKSAVPVTRFVDVVGLLTEMNQWADKINKARFKSYTKMRAYKSLEKYFNRTKAPNEMTFLEFIMALDGLMDKKVGRGENLNARYRALMVGGMHFMDGYNYELERVRRCVVHYAAPNGRIYPFCTYNSGPTYREQIEKRYSVSLEEWEKRNSLLITTT